MRIKQRLTAALVLGFATAAYAQNEYFLPQVAEGTFADGSFRMTFVLVNNNDMAAVVTIALTDDNGAPLQVTIPGLGTQSQFLVTLDAGATQLLQTAGAGQLRTGAARVGSTQPIGVSAIFSVYDPAGRFLTEAGVGNSPPGTEFVIPVDTTGNFNTGAAFFNAGSSTANLTMRLLDALGQETQRANDTLQPGRHRARFIAGPGQIFPSATNFRGTVVVTSSSPIAAVVLRQNGAPLSYTSLPAVPRTGGKTQINLSHVANGTFAGGGFGTTFPIFNTSSATANVTVTLTRDDGTPFPVTLVGRGTASTFNLVLAAGASVFLETDGAGGLAAGAAVITSTAPIGASAIFSVFDPQGRFTTEAGVGDAPALTALTLPVDISASSDTGIAFYNPNTAAATLSIRLVDASGRTLATTQITLAGRGHAARFATQFFPGNTSFRGSIAVTADGSAVSAITLRQNTGPLTYTTLPVASGVARLSPVERRARAGIYAWGFDRSALPAGTNALAWGAGLVRDFGSRTIRVALTPQDSYGVNPLGPFDLARAAASPAYDALFRDAAFDTYLLTTYSAADSASVWSDGYDAAESAAERSAIAALASHLLATYPGKTFIILPWEGDNAIRPFAASASAWDGYRAWIEARAAGVREARAANPASAALVWSGLEFNLVRDLTTGKPCDARAVHCIVSDVAPSASVDYFSYSSWQSIGLDTADDALVARLRTDLDFALATIRAGRPDVERAHLLLGEYGFAREVWGECRAARRAGQVLRAAEAWGAAFGIAWQIVDDDASLRTANYWTGHGLYAADGRLGLVGQTLARYYATGATDPPPAPSCPAINPGGVVNSATLDATIYGDTSISIFGTFTATGNVVHVWHPSMRYVIGPGSPFWYESATKINATLPGVPAATGVIVFVSDGNRMDSNGQFVTVLSR